MSEYKLSSVDIPWAKGYSAERQLTLPSGVSAIIPNPVGEGYVQLSHGQYRAALDELARPDDSYVADEEPPHIQGFIDLREEVAAIHGLSIATARIKNHIESDQEYAEGEQS